MTVSDTPVEVKCFIAEYLDKSSLKSLHFVSKQWCTIAEPLLFDRIYISPRQKDLQVFELMTLHPNLGRAIKTLIFDVSSVPTLEREEHFLELCEEIRSTTIWLSKKFPFNCPDARLTQFVNAIIERETTFEDLYSEYGEDDLVTDGFHLWQELLEQERSNLKRGLHGIFFEALCSGLRQLPNLQTVKMDDDIWRKNQQDISDTLIPANINLDEVVVPVASPLARSWHPWHLRPKKPRDIPDGEIPEHLFLMIEALAETQHKIKKFFYEPFLGDGLCPSLFTRKSIKEGFPFHMVAALSQLQSLDLKITPRDSHVIDPENAGALGFLPQLLEQLSGLKNLNFQLIPSTLVKKTGRGLLAPVDEPYYSYSQVFPRNGKWPHLRYLYLNGLTISGMDFCTLFLFQMPALKRLWISYFELLDNRWESAVEVLRYRGSYLPWELVSLQSAFRQKDGQWWPSTRDKADDSFMVYQEYLWYIRDGGRHPSLPPALEDSQSISYLNEIFHGVDRDRIRDFQTQTEQLARR